MPYNVLISKIRCSSPNLKSTATKNRNYLVYIATREGTDLTILDAEEIPEEASPGDYLKYIHERPRSQGIFGNLEQSDDIKKISESLYQLSKTKNIYRGIISLDERDAISLGYNNKEKWNTYLKSVMPDLAEQFNIPPSKLQWVAAFHPEKGHPHVHIMFWRSDNAVQSPFIHTSTQNACRELLSKKMFEEEHLLKTVQKTASRDLVLELGKNVLEEELEELTTNLVGLQINSGLMPRISKEVFSQTNEELLKLISLLPKQGRLSYKFLPPPAKEQMGKVVESLLQKKDLQTEYLKFQEHIKSISFSYSLGEAKGQIVLDNAISDLNKRLSNLILRTIKPLLKTQDYYINSIESFADNLATPDFSQEQDQDLPVVQEEHLVSSEVMNHSISESKAECNQETVPLTVMQIFAMDALKDGDNKIMSAHEAFSILEEIPVKDSHVLYHLGKAYLIQQNNPEKSSTYLKQSADLNNPLAQYTFGKWIYTNAKTQQDVNSGIHYITLSAKQGDPNATYFLGKFYSDKSANFYDPTKALQYFHRSLSYGKHHALYDLSKIYLETEHYDLRKAIRYLSKYANLGNEHAQHKLRELYVEKTGSIQYLQRSAQSMDTYSQYYLGKLYYDSPNVEQNIELAMKYLTISSTQGNSNALYTLGKIHLDEKLPLYDPNKAINYLERSCKHGNPHVLYTLARFYLDPKHYNLKKAVRYLNKATESGNAFAKYKLGCLYFEKANSVYYLKELADSGNIHSQYYFGKALYDSPKLKQNVELAIKYLTASSSQKNPHALYILGKIYVDENTPFYDSKKAIEYLKESASCENHYAMLKLGNMYLWGKHTKKNEELGKEWLDKAIKNGNPFALDSLKAYNTFKTQHAISTSYKLFVNLYSALTQEGYNIEQMDYKYRSKSKAAKREEARKHNLKIRSK